MLGKNKENNVKSTIIVCLIGAVMLMDVLTGMPTGKAAGLTSVTDTLGNYNVGQTTWHNANFNIGERHIKIHKGSEQEKCNCKTYSSPE